MSFNTNRNRTAIQMYLYQIRAKKNFQLVREEAPFMTSNNQPKQIKSATNKHTSKT